MWALSNYEKPAAENDFQYVFHLDNKNLNTFPESMSVQERRIF